MSDKIALLRDLRAPAEDFLKRGLHVDLDGVDLSDRLVLAERFHRKPGINADIQNAAESTREIANPDFEILGVNASSDDVTFDPEGGITIETDGADGDEVIVLPHLDTDQSIWTKTTWGTDQETRWETMIKTFVASASLTKAIIWAGLKLTNTEVTATDNDQVFFRYEEDVNDGKWQAVYSVDGTDNAKDTGLAVAASSVYHLAIEIDKDRVALFFINGVLVLKSAALTDAKDLIPYVGVAADGTTPGAKKITLRWIKASRKYA